MREIPHALKRARDHSVLTVLLLAVALVISTLPTEASADTSQQAQGPPPVQYQALVIAHYTNPTGAAVLYRRGWWNSATDKGFGYDKVTGKHKITNQKVVQLTVENPKEIVPQGGGRYIHWGRFVRNDCSGSSCVEVESTWVKTIVDFSPWRLLGTGEQLGVNTSYCEGAIACPEWINRVATFGGYANLRKPTTAVVYDGAS